MAITIKDLLEDWSHSRDALQNQLNLMKADQFFPDASLSEKQRNGIRSEIELLIARYDNLIVQYK